MLVASADSEHEQDDEYTYTSHIEDSAHRAEDLNNNRTNNARFEVPAERDLGFDDVDFDAFLHVSDTKEQKSDDQSQGTEKERDPWGYNPSAKRPGTGFDDIDFDAFINVSDTKEKKSYDPSADQDNGWGFPLKKDKKKKVREEQVAEGQSLSDRKAEQPVITGVTQDDPPDAVWGFTKTRKKKSRVVNTVEPRVSLPSPSPTEERFSMFEDVPNPFRKEIPAPPTRSQSSIWDMGGLTHSTLETTTASCTR